MRGVVGGSLASFEQCLDRLERNERGEGGREGGGEGDVPSSSACIEPKAKRRRSSSQTLWVTVSALSPSL